MSLLDRASLKKVLFSGYLWALSGRFITAISGLAINFFLARLLSPDELGAYFLVVSVVTLLTMVALLGLQRSIIRLVSDAVVSSLGGRVRDALRKSVIICISVSLLIGAFMGAYGDSAAYVVFDSTLMGGVMWAAVLLLLFRSLSSFYAEAFRAFHDIRSAVLLNGTLVNVCFTGVLAYLYSTSGSANLEQVLVVSFLVYMLNVIVAKLMSLKWSGLLNRAGTISYGEIMRVSLPLMMTSLTLFVMTQADLWVVGVVLSEDDVAVYGAAVKLVQLVVIPLMIINAVLPSLVSELYSRNEVSLLERLLRVSASVAAIPAVVALVVIIFWSQDVLRILYGEFYVSGHGVLVIIALGQLVNVLAGAGMIVLMMVGQQVTAMAVSFVAGILVIAGSLAMVGSYGIEGVATAVAVTVALQAIAVLVIVKIKVGVWSHIGVRGLMPVFNYIMKHQ